ncbi:hypothetical protein Cni_G02233 [Canna indica]|uniref:Inner centromere protein ARK-binding domain-containing protein n=1 Tax=Canna indica TaxID=4628 RepID=A0AAQ3PZU3_9LILI|nr:hypothetical protein Cni_G02233 [Canna indica]
MTTMEHLFMQIFDQKARIESQLRQQIESYGESLAYNLLADGGRLPPWLFDTRYNAPGCSDQEVFSREQIIQGILLPPPWVTTPSTNHNIIYSMPAFKSTNINQYSSFVNEVSISNEHIHPKNIDFTRTTSHYDDQRDPNMVCSEVVEESQFHRSRQRNTENHLSTKSQASNFEDVRVIEQHSHRITRSVAPSLMSDHVKELSVTMNSFPLYSKYGDVAAPSKSLDYQDNTLKPSFPSGFINNKVTADQASFVSNIPRKSNDLTVNNIHDASVRECCTGAAGKELISNGSNFVEPGFITTLSSASRLSQNQSFVVMKKLSFDGIDFCCLGENTYGSFSQKENICCSSESELEKLSVQSIKKKSFLKDSLHGPGSVHHKNDSFHAEAVQSAELAASSSMEKERMESQCHPTCTSHSDLCEKFSSMSKEAKRLRLSNEVSHSSPTSMLRFDSNFSANQQSCEPSTRTQSSIEITRQPHTSFDVEPMVPCELNKDGANPIEETTSPIFQPVNDKEFHMNSNIILCSSTKFQLDQEGILPIMEVRKEEAKRISDKLHVEERDEEIDTLERVTSRFDVKVSPLVPAMRSLEKACTTHSSEKQSNGSVEHIMKDSYMGKLVKKEVFSQDQLTHFQGDKPVLLADDEVLLETECTEFVTVEIGNRTVARPTLIVHNDENDPAGIRHQLLRSSNATSSPCSNNYQSVLLEKESVVDSTIKDVPESVVAEKLPNVSSKEDKLTNVSHLRCSISAPKDVDPCKENNSIVKIFPENVIAKKSPNVSALEDKQSNLNYLRNSTSAPNDVDPCKDNSCLLHFSGKTLPLELMKDESYENKMDAIEKSLVRLPSARTCSHSSESRYFIRSLKWHEKAHTSSELNGTGKATNSKRSRKTAEACEISWPKRRKLNCYSDGILATTPRIRLHQLLHTQEDTLGTNKRSLEGVSLVEMQTRQSPSGSMLTSDLYNIDLESHSEDNHQSRKQYEREDVSCSKTKHQVMDISLATPSTNAFPSHMADWNSRTSLLNEISSSQYNVFNLEKPGTLGDEADDGLNCIAAKGYCSNLQSADKLEVCDSEKCPSTHDATVLSNCKDEMVDCDQFMPEFEGFNIGVSPVVENDISCSSDCLPFRKEQTSADTQCGCLVDLVTPKVCQSGNCKINKLPDVFQSLPTGLLEHMKLNKSLYINSDNVQEFWTGEHDRMSSLYSNLGSTFDCSYVERSYSHSTPSSGAKFGWRASKPPLTPPIEKSSLRKVSGKSGASSQTLGTNPELVCFRIDENSNTLEDNEISVNVETSEDGICSEGVQVREPLQDVSSLYNKAPTLAPLTKTLLERGSLEFLDPKSCYGTENNIDSSFGSSYPSNSDPDQMEDKENQYLKVNANKERKVVRSLSNRSSESEINVKTAGRNRSEASTQKGCKPSNIISNISSFIPIVRKKQQGTTTKGKKDIKVKALEAAEAAKRLEEKKQNEREMRKAAAKLERERLEQEKQLKQKQLEEEKRKKEADIAARKRQREEEKKEKERKRRCVEEARKLQREQDERLHPNKEEKEIRMKTAVGDAKKKGKVQEAKQQLKSEREAAGFKKTELVEPSTTKVIVNLDGMRGIIQDRMSTSKENEGFQSYDISPYKDSDDEDVEEETMRKMKQIPSWARRESLEQILLWQQDLDPVEIFSRKSSFSLSEVLYPPAARRWPL